MKTQAAAGLQRGLTLIELATVIVIVAVVSVLLLERLLPLLGEAEHMHIRMNHDALVTAVNLESARRVLRGDGDEVEALAGSNPVALLDQPPDGYLGELAHPDPAAIAGGSWYFDREQGVLVYRVRQARYFQSEIDGPARLRFRIESMRDNSGASRAARLSLLDPYDWQPLDSELRQWMARMLE